MRVTLSDPTLVRQAGRFVWLELNYDKDENQPFLGRHGVQWTPTLLVIDPTGERITAEHTGGVTIPELIEFLERGERGMRAPPAHAADASLQRGDV
ncbi:MAG TPA: thiol reductase thioredoxin, partial [Myxococcaceae bacterium]